MIFLEIIIVLKIIFLIYSFSQIMPQIKNNNLNQLNNININNNPRLI